MFSLIIFSLTQKSAASCSEDLIYKMEEKYNIPKGLLLSISKVESNMNANALNIQGEGYHARDKEEAILKINDAFNSNINNIDIGCMQINYKYHGDKFKSIESMLEPEKNIEYAAKFLSRLYYNSKMNWSEAISKYHSGNPFKGTRYTLKILRTWVK